MHWLDQMERIPSVLPTDDIINKRFYVYAIRRGTLISRAFKIPIPISESRFRERLFAETLDKCS